MFTAFYILAINFGVSFMDYVDYGKLFIGVPYKWGGQHPAEGYDCSGFVQEVLSIDGVDPAGDQTAKGLYEKITAGALSSYSPANIKRNDLLFFGNPITHIAIAVDANSMLEAGGGNSKTVDIKTAVTQQAMVRIRPIRKDLTAVLRVAKQLEMDI